ncbi:flagellar hook-associated protein FlgL [Pseudomonadales bacterium]|jgi:flagellar hook-associated protein 3 FlgL|nr:flagellar hook-associated protein FlgL [Pseudomonadales bacterium]
MRISSNQQFQQGIDALLRQQAKLAETQEQLATGNRILTPSDDPAASTQLIKLSALSAANQQFDRNIVFAQNDVDLSESKLKSAGDIIQRVRELVVQANNATNSDQSRSAIATEIENNLYSMRDLANSKDATGDYLFSGFNATTKPFVKEGSGYVYKGDQGERFLQIADGIQIQVRDTGTEIFQKIRNGDGRLRVAIPDSNQGSALVNLESTVTSLVGTYSIEFFEEENEPLHYRVLNEDGEAVVGATLYEPDQQVSFNDINVSVSGSPVAGDKIEIEPSEFQDVFTTLQLLVDKLKAPIASAPPNSLSNHLTQSLQEMDLVLDKFLSVRSSLGSRLQELDTAKGQNADEDLRLQRSVGALKDLDYAEAVSRLNMQMTGLQAAQQAYVKVQGLSLFNFL